MSSLLPLLLVGLGGCAGALARYFVARSLSLLVDTRFPLGTFAINVSGSFLLGLVGTLVAAKLFPNSDAVRLGVGVGFLGAYTTFSTFEFETHALLEDGSWVLMGANVVGSVVLGLIAVRMGVLVARNWVP